MNRKAEENILKTSFSGLEGPVTSKGAQKWAPKRRMIQMIMIGKVKPCDREGAETN